MRLRCKSVGERMPQGKSRGRSACYGRLWFDEVRSTVVTRAEPHQMRLLHPLQHRVISIRENARCQVGASSPLPLGGPASRGWCLPDASPAPRGTGNRRLMPSSPPFPPGGLTSGGSSLPLPLSWRNYAARQEPVPLSCF